jgi:hypothetical protein
MLTINQDDIDTNKLFHLLPPAHRDAFLATIRNPESEQAKALVEVAATQESLQEPAGPSVLPWWEASHLDDEDDKEEGPSYETSPALLDDNLLRGITPPAGIGGKLAYNAIAVT